MTNELVGFELLALRIAYAQVARGDAPSSNIATTCVLALARLTGHEEPSIEIDPRWQAQSDVAEMRFYEEADLATPVSG